MKAAWIAALALGLARLGAAPGNSVVLDLAASPEYPRNSEGAFATLKSGRIVFAYSQFYHDTGDSSPARIAETHSDDQGLSWSASRVLISNGGHLGLMSVSFLRLADGRLALFYVIKDSVSTCHPVMRVSSDEGATWGPDLPIIAAPGYFVLNNDRVIQDRRGRIIVPVAYHRTLATDPRAADPVDLRGIVLWYYSDDTGATWRQSPTWWGFPRADPNGLQEPGVVELADGSLLSWARTGAGCQYQFHSRDRGETWSPPEPSELKSPISPCSIKRLPGSGALLAVYNDHSGRFPFPRDRPFWEGRSPLVAAISGDNGRTWPWRKTIETLRDWNYCYTAIQFTDDAVLLAYVAADSNHASPQLLRLRRLSRSWLGSD